MIYELVDAAAEIKPFVGDARDKMQNMGPSFSAPLGFASSFARARRADA